MRYDNLLNLCNEFNFKVKNNEILYENFKLEIVGIIERNKNNYIVYTQPFMSTPISSIKKIKTNF